MPAYKVYFSYSFEDFGESLINADDEEQAEMFATEYVRETYPEAHAILIEKVEEFEQRRAK